MARELELVALVAVGMSTRNIGERVAISPCTVQHQLATALRKSGSCTRVRAARHYRSGQEHEERDALARAPS